MKLIHSNTSPFVRKVMVALMETGQRDAVELETVAVSPVNPGDVVPSLNPLGKIPCLILDNGNAIFDSRVICRYVDSRHNSAKLYPEGAALWPRLTLEAAADGMVDAAILMIYERLLREESQRSPAWEEGQWQKVARGLAYLEANVEKLEGLDMANIAVACALGYLEFRFADRNWRVLAPNLSAWEADFSQRPSMQATIPA